MALGTVYQLNNATITASGSVLIGVESGHESVLFWNIQGSVTGTIQFTLQEVDPNDNVTAIGNSVVGAVVSGAGVGQIIIRQTTSPVLLLKWTVTGGSPSIAGTSLTVASREVGNAETNLQTAAVNSSTAGNNTIVAGVSGKSIYVMSYCIQAQGSSNVLVQFQDNATALMGSLSFNAREGSALSTSFPSFLFATSVGNPLILNLSGAFQVSGFVTYWTA